MGDFLPAVKGRDSNKPAAKELKGTTKISATSSEQLLVREETTRQQLQWFFHVSS